MSNETEKTLRIHLGLVLAEVICVPAFVFELWRALGGNLLSWAYVFEWPILGAYAVYMWRRMLNEARGVVKERHTRHASTPSEADDPQLAAWNEYLAKLNQADAERRDV